MAYPPRIDEDLLHILWLKARVEGRPITKVLNPILRELLEKEDVKLLEAQVKGGSNGRPPKQGHHVRDNPKSRGVSHAPGAVAEVR